MGDIYYPRDFPVLAANRSVGGAGSAGCPGAGGDRGVPRLFRGASDPVDRPTFPRALCWLRRHQYVWRWELHHHRSHRGGASRVRPMAQADRPFRRAHGSPPARDRGHGSLRPGGAAASCRTFSTTRASSVRVSSRSSPPRS